MRSSRKELSLGVLGCLQCVLGSQAQEERAQPRVTIALGLNSLSQWRIAVET